MTKAKVAKYAKEDDLKYDFLKLVVVNWFQNNLARRISSVFNNLIRQVCLDCPGIIETFESVYILISITSQRKRVPS